ncbi:MAG: flippase-like domain-containing protein [Acidimicrobiia bacterium]|nr:flippase-like domain-containing protein [Acidimicrobiia bacterium]
MFADVAKNEGLVAEGPSRGWRRALRWLVLLVGFGILARFLMLGWPQIVESVGALDGTQRGLIVLAVLIEGVWLFAQSQVYRSALVGFGGSASNRKALGSSTAAFSLSRILPGGGAVGSLYAANQFIKLGNRPALTIGSMMTSWWVSMTTLAVIVLGGVIVGVTRYGIDPGHIVGPSMGLGVMAVIGGLGWLVLHNDRVRSRLEPRIAKLLASRSVGESVGEPDAALDEIRAGISPRTLSRIAFWSASAWLCDLTALWLCFAALGHPVGITPLVIGYGMVNLIGALPELTPGWLGVIEVSLAGVFAIWGIPASLSVVAVLAYRLVSYWLPVAVGLAPAIRLLRGGHIAQATA